MTDDSKRLGNTYGLETPGIGTIQGLEETYRLVTPKTNAKSEFTLAVSQYF